MKKAIIILALLMMILAGGNLIAGGRSAPRDQQQEPSAKASGGLINSAASIIIQTGAYIVITGQGNYISQGSGTTSGSGTIDLTGDLINNNDSGNPLSTEGTVLFSGESEQSISGNPIIFGNVTFNNPAGISIDCETEIEGDMDISAGTVSMTNESNLWLANRDIAFGGENYLTALTVALINEPGSADENESIDKRWNITGNSSGSVLVTLRWTDAENNGNDFSSGEAKVWTFNGSSWNLIGSYLITIDGGYNTVSFLRSFGTKDDLDDYTITGDNQTLPVTLSSFTGTMIALDLIRLVWVSQSESNLHGYQVLRGENSNLAQAQVVSNLIDATNTSSSHTYVFNDNELQGSGIYFYWLMVSETNGEICYHGPISVDLSDPGLPEGPSVLLETRLLPAYPNPFNPSTHIPYELRTAGKVQIEIYDIRGRIVWNQTLEHSSAGSFGLRWEGVDNNGRPVTSGIYFYRMKAGKYSQVNKLVMLK